MANITGSDSVHSSCARLWVQRRQRARRRLRSYWPLGQRTLGGERRGSPCGGEPVDTLYLLGTRPTDTDVPEEVIRVLVPFTGPGSYSLNRDAVAFTVLIGGDAVSAEYGGQGPTAGTLEVDTYDARSGVMSGTIEFDAEAMTDFRPYGPSARFENGRFRARLPQQ
jgi:hypothetical protein